MLSPLFLFSRGPSSHRPAALQVAPSCPSWNPSAGVAAPPRGADYRGERFHHSKPSASTAATGDVPMFTGTTKTKSCAMNLVDVASLSLELLFEFYR